MYLQILRSNNNIYMAINKENTYFDVKTCNTVVVEAESTLSLADVHP